MVKIKEILAPSAARSTICPVAVLTKKVMCEIEPGGISTYLLARWRPMWFTVLVGSSESLATTVLLFGFGPREARLLSPPSMCR